MSVKVEWSTGAPFQAPPNAPEFGGSSPIGLVVILILFIATFVLVRSMNKHLKKVPPSFDPPEQTLEAGESATGDTGPAGRAGRAGTDRTEGTSSGSAPPDRDSGTN